MIIIKLDGRNLVQFKDFFLLHLLYILSGSIYQNKNSRDYFLDGIDRDSDWRSFLGFSSKKKINLLKYKGLRNV